MQPTKDNLEPDVKNRTSNPDVINVLDYLEVVAKRWRMIVKVTIAAAVISSAYSFTRPNIYTAKAKLLPPQQQSGLLSAAMMQGALAAIGSDMLMGESKSAKLYSEMLKIETLRDSIINRFKLQEVYKKKYREDIYKELNKAVTITTGKEGIITIEVDDKDAKRSANIANAFVDELKKLTSKMNMTGASNSRTFLEERISSSKKELMEAENNVKSFQAKYKMLDAQQQAGATMGILTQLTAQLSMQELQLNTLLRTLSGNNQVIKNLRQSIASLRIQIAKYEKSGNGILPGFENVPQRGQEYLHLMRRFKTAESVFEMLTKQYEMARLNSENDVSTIQVIQVAGVPDRKSKPKRMVVVIASILVAGLGAIVTAFIQEFMEHMSAVDRERWRKLKALTSINSGLAK